MHAFLIVGDNPLAINEEVAKLSSKNKESPLEFSIGKIEKTRELSAFLKLSQPTGTTIVIRGVDEATVDSLNAFLKNLEEPNTNVTFILTARNEFKIIPTILSRCQIIRTKKTKSDLNEKTIAESKNFIEEKVGGKLQTIDKIKKREDTIPFLQNLLTYLQQTILDNNIDYYRSSEFLKIIQQTLDAINQNGNVTMQLTNMVVKMEKTTGYKASGKV